MSSTVEQDFCILHPGLVWSGSGLVNGLKIHCREQQEREFLVTPHTPLEIKNSSAVDDLIVFTVFPLKKLP